MDRTKPENDFFELAEKRISAETEAKLKLIEDAAFERGRRHGIQEGMNLEKNAIAATSDGSLKIQAPSNPVSAAAGIEAQCRATWQGSAKLREDYGNNFDAFIAYTKAEAAGRVRTSKPVASTYASS